MATTTMITMMRITTMTMMERILRVMMVGIRVGMIRTRVMYVSYVPFLFLFLLVTMGGV